MAGFENALRDQIAERFGYTKVDERCRISLTKVFQKTGLWKRRDEIDLRIDVDSAGIITLTPCERIPLHEFQKMIAESEPKKP